MFVKCLLFLGILYTFPMASYVISYGNLLGLFIKIEKKITSVISIKGLQYHIAYCNKNKSSYFPVELLSLCTSNSLH